MADGYVPNLLVETGWLAEHLADPGTVIVEMGTGADDFIAGHIPGAVRCPSPQIKGTEEAGRRLVAPPDEAKALFESLGVADDTLVIAYDRFRNRDASRLWWVLSYYGHQNVRVLNGGWKKWTLESRPVENGEGRVPAPVTFTPRPNDAVRSDVPKLLSAIDNPSAFIWDIRATDEFEGINDRGNARVGHVPGARHLEWVNLVNEEDHTFLPPDQLREVVGQLGPIGNKAVHIY